MNAYEVIRPNGTIAARCETLTAANRFVARRSLPMVYRIRIVK